jgi:C-terminal processing protease CtpA/Prc
MKKYIVILLICFGLISQISCEKDNLQIDYPDVTIENEIQDFIWQGMNLFYLWQGNVDDLSDDRFSTQSEYINFLNSKPQPEDFFENLIYNRGSVDHWSWIVDDYIEQDKSFQGISLDNGVDFGLISINGDDVIGYVRYIVPNSDAINKNIKRGDIITHVNGTKLNINNYYNLLFGENSTTYILGLAKIEDNIIVPTGVDVDLTKTELTENPIHIVTTIDADGHKIGYIMYNWFTRSFDNDLNAAFLQLKNDGITDLVVDLRYNPGGYVSSAHAISSMITGQFKGEIFSKEEWNSKWQAELEKSDPGSLTNYFSDKLNNGNSINSLGLSKVHFIVTGKSASASELVISSLNPYINVRLVGNRTVGKYVASTTLYDSNNFSKNGANPNHTYAIQPIIYQTVNKLGESAKGGFEPHVILEEDPADLGVLGNSDEAMLNAAIEDITGVVSKKTKAKQLIYKRIGDSKMNSPIRNNMYVDKDDKRELIKKIRSKEK